MVATDRQPVRQQQSPFSLSLSVPDSPSLFFFRSGTWDGGKGKKRDAGHSAYLFQFREHERVIRVDFPSFPPLPAPAPLPFNLLTSFSPPPRPMTSLVPSPPPSVAVLSSSAASATVVVVVPELPIFSATDVAPSVNCEWLSLAAAVALSAGWVRSNS